jgi:uncharacterized protein YprB with RNaseH-like and TPR domain
MSKFDFLDRFHKSEKLDPDRLAVSEFAAQIGAEIFKSDSGNYLELVTDYDANYCHGQESVASVLSCNEVNIGTFEINEADQPLDIREAVFVDAETTGLSAAAGTVAFLLGVGYVRDESFKVHQFFLPDYPDEPAMLDAVSDLVEDRSCVCTFNGKCFDLPLLETRYILHRRRTPFADMTRIDLLHSSRRFWRGRFADNTLQTLERELLGLYRYHDTPGYMIPQLYFDFLKHGESQPLEGVLLHNRLDIVSLLFLLRVTQKYLDDAQAFDYYSPEEAFLISKYLLRRGDLAGSCMAAESQFGRGKIDGTAAGLGFHLGVLQKRLGKFDDALSTYRTLSRTTGESRLRALEGAAKLLEHNFGDHKMACELTLSAIDYLDNPASKIPYDRVLFWNETLTKRHRRLLRKLK